MTGIRNYKQSIEKMEAMMAKDDFHVIAYRILDYLYECMKKGESPEVEYLTKKPMELMKDILIK